MNKSQKVIIVSVLAGLLFGLLALMFEVPSVRVMGRFGAFALLLALVAAFLVWFNPVSQEKPVDYDACCKSRKGYKSERGSVAGTLIGFVVLVSIAFIAAMGLFEYPSVKGDEIGVLETWDGVKQEGLAPKTYPIFRPTNEIYTYKVTPQKYENTIEVKSSDNQRVHIAYTIRWRRNPDKIVWMHQKLRDPLVAIVPAAERVVGNNATVEHAIAIYSGETQNALRLKIENQLKDKDGLLATSGVIVEQFVFGKIDLSPDYVAQIEQRQVAIISQTRAIEQQKAALAQAEVVKAEAQQDLNKQVVAAQRDKDVAILQQQAISEKSTIEANARALNLVVEQKSLSEKQVLAAEAQAKATIAASEATKQAEINRAVGIEAVGKAEAEAQKLRLQSFAVTGADNFTKIEVAKQLAIAYQNQKGYLPANMGVNLLTDNFQKSVSLVVDGNAK